MSNAFFDYSTLIEEMLIVKFVNKSSHRLLILNFDKKNTLKSGYMKYNAGGMVNKNLKQVGLKNQVLSEFVQLCLYLRILKF